MEYYIITYKDEHTGHICYMNCPNLLLCQAKLKMLIDYRKAEVVDVCFKQELLSSIDIKDILNENE